MKSNKSKISCKRGFTLIELLVVVLIIGILAAVAVPQYRVAVEKSRVAQVLTRLEALYKAGAIYYLENGVYPADVRDVAIDITHDAVEFKKNSDLTTTDHVAAFYPDGSACSIFDNDRKYVACMTEHVWLFHELNAKRWCQPRSELGTKICKILNVNGETEGNTYYM